MTFETFSKIQAAIPDGQLIEKAKELISKLAKTGGRSWSLRVPPDPENDPDMVFGEIARRLSLNGGLTPVAYFLGHYEQIRIYVCATNHENPIETKWDIRQELSFRMNKKDGSFHLFPTFSDPNKIDQSDFQFDTVKEAADCYKSFHLKQG